MNRGLIISAALASSMASSLLAMQPAQAQGYVIDNGATVIQNGPAVIDRDATVGMSPGVAIIAPDVRPRFHTYVVERHVPSYSYRGAVAVGNVLPESGVTYYDVPREFGASQYRYTVVNDEPVLVDPSSRRIVQVIDAQ